MNKNAKKAEGFFCSDNLIPMVLSAVVMSSVAYIYACGSAAVIIVYSLASVVYSFVIFAIYEFLRKKGKTGLSMISVIAMFSVASTIGYGIVEEPSQAALWFMEPSRFTKVYYGNTTALVLFFGIILISCLYYFTRVRYRGIFVFLICMCPFALFAKTFTDIPVIFPVIIMTLFFFIMIANSDDSTHKAGKRSKGEKYAAVAFVLTVTVIASFFPKLEHAPYREQFDEFVTGVSIGAAGGAADFSDFSDKSSSTTSKDEDTVIFRFRGKAPELIKRQCFNLYDSENNAWSYLGNSNEGFSRWSKYVLYEDPGILYKLCGVEGGYSEKRECRVISENGFIRAIYTPENIVSLSTASPLEGEEGEHDIYRTEMDEYFLSRSDDEVSGYTMGWCEAEIDTEFEKLFTDEYAEELSETSDTARSYILAKEDAEKYDEYLRSDTVMDGCYGSKDARTAVHNLAESVTEGYETDYQKARAIEQFFKKGDFIYDKQFTTPDASPENFILNTKRGACAAYATAMTLMCREAGLNARYCEGFWVQQMDGNGEMFVTSGDSHAYVQVWINGYGWTDFNPTSNVQDNGYFDLTFVYVGIAAFAAAALGFLVLLIRPRAEKVRFVRRLKKARGAEQYSLAYCRINDVINKYMKNRTNTFTPEETAEKCLTLFGYDIGAFIRKYEEAVYGGRNPGNDCSGVYDGFMAAYRQKLKSERKRKKK